MTLSTMEIFSAITSFLGTAGIIGYIFERRKNKALAKGVEADTEGKEIENKSSEINLYKSIIDDLELRYKKRYEDTAELWQKKYKMLEEEVVLLERSYKRKVVLLESENKLQRQMINALKKDIKERDTEIKRLKSLTTDESSK